MLLFIIGYQPGSREETDGTFQRGVRENLKVWKPIWGCKAPSGKLPPPISKRGKGKQGGAVESRKSPTVAFPRTCCCVTTAMSDERPPSVPTAQPFPLGSSPPVPDRGSPSKSTTDNANTTCGNQNSELDGYTGWWRMCPANQGDQNMRTETILIYCYFKKGV